MEEYSWTFSDEYSFEERKDIFEECSFDVPRRIG